MTCEALVQRSDEDIKDWWENFCLGNLFECPIDICRCTAMVLDEDFYWSKHWSLDLPNTGTPTTKNKRSTDKRVCRSIGSTNTSFDMDKDLYCQMSCNHNPPHCPSDFCTCNEEENQVENQSSALLVNIVSLTALRLAFFIRYGLNKFVQWFVCSI